MERPSDRDRFGIDPKDIILSGKDKLHPLLSQAEWLFDINEEV